jgi:hypothetical protein
MSGNAASIKPKECDKGVIRKGRTEGEELENEELEFVLFVSDFSNVLQRSP